jgi:hypothetical protein
MKKSIEFNILIFNEVHFINLYFTGENAASFSESLKI